MVMMILLQKRRDSMPNKDVQMVNNHNGEIICDAPRQRWWYFNLRRELFTLLLVLRPAFEILLSPRWHCHNTTHSKSPRFRFSVRLSLWDNGHDATIIICVLSEYYPRHSKVSFLEVFKSGSRMFCRPIWCSWYGWINKYGVPVSQMIHGPLSCLVSR